MSLPGRSGEGAAEEREPCKSSGGQGSGYCFVWLSAVQPGLRDLLTSCPSHLSDCCGLCPLPEAPSLLFRTRLLLSVSWVFSSTNHKTQLRNRSKGSPAPLLRRHHMTSFFPSLCSASLSTVMSSPYGCKMAYILTKTPNSRKRVMTLLHLHYCCFEKGSSYTDMVDLGLTVLLSSVPKC